MVPSIEQDWLSILLITGAVVPALGAAFFGFFVLRRREPLLARLSTNSAAGGTYAGEAP